MLSQKLRELNGQHIFSLEGRTKVISLSENDRLTELVRTTGDDIQNLYVSDASDSFVYIYKADGQFQYVREFELSAEEKAASSGYRELLAVQKVLETDADQFKENRGGTVYWN